MGTTDKAQKRTLNVEKKKNEMRIEWEKMGKIAFQHSSDGYDKTLG